MNKTQTFVHFQRAGNDDIVLEQQDRFSTLQNEIGNQIRTSTFQSRI